MNWLRRGMVREAGQVGLTGLLCGLMVVPQAAFAAGASATPASASAKTASARERHEAPVERVAPLTEQQRVLHALNRFTFGPRPGDEAAVERMGLDRWFEQQLHPETIDDSGFDERMMAFPAMHLTQQELMRRFPSPQTIRAMEKRGDVEIPSDPAEKAIYRDAEAMYSLKVKQQAKGETPPATNALGNAANNSAQEQQAAQTQPDSTMRADANGGQAQAVSKKTKRQEMHAGEQALLSDGTMGPPAATQATDAQADQETMQDVQQSATGADAQPKMMASEPTSKKGKRKDNAAPMDYGDVQAIVDLAPAERMQRLVAMRPDEFMAFRAALRPAERTRLMQGLAPEQVETLAAMTTQPVRVVGSEALESRLERDVYSERQLQAVMTDFWLNHFSVYAKKNQNEPYYLPGYEREVILPNALGKFENLLVATAKSPAMLMYLDNWESVGPHSDAVMRQQEMRFRMIRPNAKIPKNLPKGINENYGRELMELHTLGVNGGYTQQDVIEVSKCFTGWTIERPYQGGGAVFDESKHEPGTKIVLGHKITDNGAKEGMEVLHILATSPATAHFISQKIAVRFVSDDPPAALVDRMADTFLKTDGDIKAVLLTMFHSPEFWSPQVYRAKVKTPVEFMASALRASGATVRNPLPLVQAMDRLGMPIYGMQTPNGYSWKADEWVSSNALISRMNFALVLSSDRLPGTRTDWSALLGEEDSAAAEAKPDAATERKLEALLLGQPATTRTRETVLAQFTNPTAQQSAEEGFKARPASDAEDNDMVGGARLLRARAGRDGQGRLLNAPETPLDTMAGLLLGSPEFQRR
jgi:uncharacterized protein (DUF1800 family)